MTSTKTLAVLGLLTLLWTVPALSSDDHGHAEGVPASTGGTASSRFSAVSQKFELVGVASGRQLTVYLDRFEDNAPVKGASLDIEIGGSKVVMKPHEDGEFEGTLAAELKPGVIAVIASVVAGDETDKLTGEIDVGPPAAARDSHAHEGRSGRTYAAWAAAAIVLLGALVWLQRRVATARRAGGAA